MMLLSNLNIAQNIKAPCTATIITQSQEICDDWLEIFAEAPEVGEVGLWEGPLGTSFVAADVPTTFVTNLLQGPNIVTWSIFDANGILCDTDSITLTNNEVITTPIIITQYYEVCDENGVELTAMPPTASGEYGVWSSDNGMVTFSPNDTTPNVTANNLVTGNNGIFWEIRNGTCKSNPSVVTIVNNEVLTNASIEPTSITETCEPDSVQGVYANVFSNNLIPGEIGTWTGPSGVTFSPNSEAPTISGLQSGPNLLVWTISRGNCAVSSDSIVLNVLDCYTPFPTDSMVWKENWYRGDSGYTIESGVELNYLLGDTLINSVKYSKVYQGWYPYSPDSIPPQIAQTLFMGLITEIDKRVYYRPHWDLELETLLYDFNLEVGDVISWNTDALPQVIYTSSATVQAIDSITITNGDIRKRYWLNDGGEIIEGIGSKTGLLYPNGNNFLDYSRELICVGTTDEILYTQYWMPNPEDRCFSTIIDVENPIFSELTLMPNPATSIINLSQTMTNVQLHIYSAIGQKVMSGDNFSGSQINIQTLPNGVYFIVIYGQENYLAKMVKESQ